MDDLLDFGSSCGSLKAIAAELSEYFVFLL